MKQYLPRTRVAQSIGGSYSQIMRTLAYWNMVTSAIVLVLGWDSGTGDLLRRVFPWMTFGWFVAIALLLFVIVSLVDFFYILPAIIAFNNHQAVKHDNPVWQMMAEIRDDVKALKGEK